MSSAGLLSYLCLGRLVRGPDGQFKDDKHFVLCAASNEDSDQVKSYRSHVQAIMVKGANKLQAGKRIRLTPDQQNYDLHVLPDLLNGDDLKMIVFFAVTDPEFDKHQSITNLFRDFKASIYEKFSVNELDLAKNIQKSSQDILSKLLATYNASKLRAVQGKVDEVKDIMKVNVQKALDNMEQLEDMEVKSEQFEEQARQFSRGATNVKKMMRCRSWKITIILFLVVATIIGVIIWYASSH